MTEIAFFTLHWICNIINNVIRGPVFDKVNVIGKEFLGTNFYRKVSHHAENDPILEYVFVFLW